jgi:hypothetical protein
VTPCVYVWCVCVFVEGAVGSCDDENRAGSVSMGVTRLKAF